MQRILYLHLLLFNVIKEIVNWREVTVCCTSSQTVSDK